MVFMGCGLTPEGKSRGLCLVQLCASLVPRPDVIHVIGVPRPPPFFALFCFRVLKLKNKKRGRPGNEASCVLSTGKEALH